MGQAGAMDNLIEFPSPSGYDGRIRPCGSAWFTVRAVRLSRERTVTGYAGVSVCLECGKTSDRLPA